METEAERNIRFVIRIFQYIGWPFAIISVASAVVGIFIGLAVLVEGARGAIVAALLIAIIPLPFAALFLSILRVTRRMKDRDLSVKSAAVNVSALMFPGFPLFTLVGALCLYRIRNYYDAYCVELRPR
jgi:hypothetical protein